MLSCKGRSCLLNLVHGTRSHKGDLLKGEGAKKRQARQARCKIGYGGKSNLASVGLFSSCLRVLDNPQTWNHTQIAFCLPPVYRRTFACTFWRVSVVVHCKSQSPLVPFSFVSSFALSLFVTFHSAFANGDTAPVIQKIGQEGAGRA